MYWSICWAWHMTSFSYTTVSLRVLGICCCGIQVVSHPAGFSISVLTCHRSPLPISLNHIQFPTFQDSDKCSRIESYLLTRRWWPATLTVGAASHGLSRGTTHVSAAVAIWSRINGLEIVSRSHFNWCTGCCNVWTVSLFFIWNQLLPILLAHIIGWGLLACTLD
jgi:hypothetical protein